MSMINTEITSITDLAEYFEEFFEYKARKDGQTYIVFSEDAPEELRELVRDAHNGELPNNLCYETARDVLYMFSNGENDRDLEAAKSNKDLLDWISECPRRMYYVDKVMTEYHIKELSDALSLGQLAHKREIFNSVKKSLESILLKTIGRN